MRNKQKAIEDQGKKQVDDLEYLKLKEQTKPIEDKPHSQSRSAIIFSELICKIRELLKELHDSVGYNNLKFEYVDPKNNNVSFYDYKDSKRIFNAIKDNQIKFNKVVKSNMSS